MKPIIFILGGVSAMIAISIASGLQCKKPEPIYIEETKPDTIYWMKSKTIGNCYINYSWKGFGGDSCCLDSIMSDMPSDPFIGWIRYETDSLGRITGVTLIADSIVIQ